MNIGAELREARSKAGLSREDLSQRTKIQLAKIDALEANAFERLPEGIYLDGLIRAYAAEVGLDGSAMVTRLHRHNAIPVEDEIEIDRIDEIDRRDEIVSREEDEIVRHEEIGTRGEIEVHREMGETGGMGVIDRADYMVPPPHASAVDPPAIIATTAPERRRRGGLLLPLLTLIAAMALGAYLYDRSQSFALDDEAATPAISHEGNDGTVANDATTASAPGASATSDVIPADRPASTEHHTDERVVEPEIAPIPGASASPRDNTPPETRPADTPKPIPSNSEPRPSAADATAGALNPTESRATGDIRATGDMPAAGDMPATADISGSWALNTRIESSTVRDYEGLELGYQLQLQQSGSRIAGEGMKTLENGRLIARFAQTPIIVSGTFEDGRLTLTFTERGHQRQSGGKMILSVSEDGVLRGRFSSSAARSSGTAEARRP